MASGYRAGIGSEQSGTKSVAFCRPHIELGLEIFEVQRELENGDVQVGLRRSARVRLKPVAPRAAAPAAPNPRPRRNSLRAAFFGRWPTSDCPVSSRSKSVT